MDKDEEFVHTFFNYIAKLCFDKAKEHIEKEKDISRSTQQFGSWGMLLTQLSQIALAEKSYIDIGFLQNKNKGFLRKDNSLKAIYESINVELRRLEDNIKQYSHQHNVSSICLELSQYINARVDLIDLYEKIYNMGSNKIMKYTDILATIEGIIQKHSISFTHIALTPIKAIFSMECEILEHLFKALTEIQRLQFIPSLALIFGAHTRLNAWESRIQSRETWTLGFLKNNPHPSLFQWLVRLKGTILSKFSLYFYNTLASQTTPSDMRQWCSKLQFDHYHKIVSFQKKYDATSILLVSDTQVSSECADCDCFPIIVWYPTKPIGRFETLLKMVSDISNDLSIIDKIIFKFNIQDQCSYFISHVEPYIYLVAVFDSKKSEKDTYIGNFLGELSTNLRCSKIFLNLKNQQK